MTDELKVLYGAENQLLKALPRMANKASSSQLKDAFTGHVKETERQVKRLQQIGGTLSNGGNMDALFANAFVLAAAGYSLVYLLGGGGFGGAVLIFIVAKILGK